MDSWNYYERSICKQKLRREIASICTMKMFGIFYIKTMFFNFIRHNVYNFPIFFFDCGMKNANTFSNAETNLKII